MPSQKFILLLIVLISSYVNSCDLKTTDSCYFFFDKLYAYDDAEKDCLSRASNLIAIDSVFTNNLIINEAENYFQSTTFWIGLRKQPDGKWDWEQTDRNYSYRNWASGEPSIGDCASAKISTSRWQSEECGMPMPYICQSPLSSMMTTNKDSSQSTEPMTTASATETSPTTQKLTSGQLTSQHQTTVSKQIITDILTSQNNGPCLNQFTYNPMTDMCYGFFLTIAPGPISNCYYWNSIDNKEEDEFAKNLFLSLVPDFCYINGTDNLTTYRIPHYTVDTWWRFIWTTNVTKIMNYIGPGEGIEVPPKPGITKTVYVIIDRVSRNLTWTSNSQTLSVFDQCDYYLCKAPTNIK